MILHGATAFGGAAIYSQEHLLHTKASDGAQILTLTRLGHFPPKLRVGDEGHKEKRERERGQWFNFLFTILIF